MIFRAFVDRSNRYTLHVEPRSASRPLGGIRFMSVFARTAFAVLFVYASVGTPAAAETAWVKDDLRLNLRTGAGTEFRIIGVMRSGDEVGILSRVEGWTQVRTHEDVEGWIPEGYLQSETPARVMLAEREAEFIELQEKVGVLGGESQTLLDSNATLNARVVEQTAQVERLSRENMAYRAGARWPEWITGATILGAGMLIGSLLKAVSGRRRTPRVRL